MVTQGGPKNRTCLSVDYFAMISGKKASDMSKVSGCFREKASDLHSGSFKYFLPNLHKSLLPLKFSRIRL